MIIVRCPSKSKIKLAAIRRALELVSPPDKIAIHALPVELQDREDLSVNAQPEGREETERYARLRLDELRRKHGETIHYDISIESGAIDGADVAMVVIRTSDGTESVAESRAVAFPPEALEEARRRGFSSVTAGDVIHEWSPDIPSDDWQSHYPPFISRETQILSAITKALYATAS